MVYQEIADAYDIGYELGFTDPDHAEAAKNTMDFRDTYDMARAHGIEAGEKDREHQRQEELNQIREHLGIELER